MASFTYDIAKYLDVSRIDDTDYLKEKSLNWNTKDNYTILKYKKSNIDSNNISTLGNFRSVIIDNKTHTVVAFSPPKSYSIKDFNDNTQKYTFEEFVEGTMVNVFFHNDEWQLSTRSILGGKGSFYDNTKTFRQMFLECMIESELEFDDLNKEYCYSFIIQHTENRIVKRFYKNNIVLCAMYKCVGTVVSSVPLSEFNCKWKGTFPKQYNHITTMEEAIQQYQSMDTPYTTQGVVITNGVIRTKLRNPKYEYVRHLRGNQSKLQYQFHVLYHNKQMIEFLQYYPEYSAQFIEYRNNVYAFIDNLYSFYHRCYAKKEKPLCEFPKEYRNHMYTIHQHYVNTERETNGYITKKFVVEYVEGLEPAHLMYAVNYKNRQIKHDTKVE